VRGGFWDRGNANVAVKEFQGFWGEGYPWERTKSTVADNPWVRSSP